jgi:hypothetical protein
VLAVDLIIANSYPSLYRNLTEELEAAHAGSWFRRNQIDL